MPCYHITKEKRKRYRLFQSVNGFFHTRYGSGSLCRWGCCRNFRGFLHWHFPCGLFHTRNAPCSLCRRSMFRGFGSFGSFHDHTPAFLRLMPLALLRTFNLLPLAFAVTRPVFFLDPNPFICYHSSRSGVSGYKISLLYPSACAAWCTDSFAYTRQHVPSVLAYRKIDIEGDKGFGVEGGVGLVSSLESQRFLKSFILDFSGLETARFRVENWYLRAI